MVISPRRLLTTIAGLNPIFGIEYLCRSAIKTLESYTGKKGINLNLPCYSYNFLAPSGRGNYILQCSTSLLVLYA